MFLNYSILYRRDNSYLEILVLARGFQSMFLRGFLKRKFIVDSRVHFETYIIM